ncbi:retrotransposon protein, putative, ty1-copia subclass [Tanacetum coccineum]
MDNSKRGSIPMQVGLHLKKSQCATTSAEMKCMQNVPYASAIGSIMYVVRCTRPDVAFVQNITSRFQQNPSEAHWIAVKNILKYLRNTKDTILVYGRNPEAELQVKCYCDAGFETDRDDTKSQTGYVFILNGGTVVWKSSKQKEKRVKELGGNFEDGYLNGELAVTRALGDRCMKSESPLIAEPEMTQMVLTKDDEFMIIGCDGIWDVMSNEDAVNLVRKQLMQHNDPQRCAAKLINQALHLHTSDNLTAIVVCLSSHIEPPKPWRPRRGFRESAQ